MYNFGQIKIIIIITDTSLWGLRNFETISSLAWIDAFIIEIEWIIIRFHFHSAPTLAPHTLFCCLAKWQVLWLRFLIISYYCTMCAIIHWTTMDKIIGVQLCNLEFQKLFFRTKKLAKKNFLKQKFNRHVPQITTCCRCVLLRFLLKHHRWNIDLNLIK